MDKPGIAILPFDDFSSDQSHQYLVDGLVEEIITELSKYRWLAVVSRNSSFAYKGRNVDARLIARELGVRYVVEGSLRSDARRLRITAQLIDGDTGEHLWADRFTASREEVFEIQDEVVHGIVGALEPTVQNAEVARSRVKPTSSLTAYDYYLQALPHRAAQTRDDNLIAIDLLDKALSLDPHFALALAHAAACIMAKQDQGWDTLSDEDVARGIRLARTAVQCDYDNPAVLYLAGHALESLANEPAEGLVLIDRAIRLSPSCAEAWARSSMVRVYGGDLSTAERHAENALRLSPLDSNIALPLCALGYCFLFTKRYGEAVAAVRRALSGRQRPPMAYRILLAASFHQGDVETARAAFRSLTEVAPSFRVSDWLAQNPLAQSEHHGILSSAFRGVGAVTEGGMLA